MLCKSPSLITAHVLVAHTGPWGPAFLVAPVHLVFVSLMGRYRSMWRVVWWNNGSNAVVAAAQLKTTSWGYRCG